MIKLFLDNFEVLATHPSQYGETKVLEMKIYPVQIMSETVEPGSEGEFKKSDRWMVRARSDQTFNKPLGFTSGTHEQERWKDEMGYRSERIE